LLLMRGDRALAPAPACVGVDARANAADIRLADPEAGIEILLQWRLEESGLMAASTSLRNTGSTPFSVSHLASLALPLPPHLTQVTRYSGRWAAEMREGVLEMPRGILLFGPPGTGKTLLAKAAASQLRATFLCLSASSIGSKWHGESEKMVKAVFAAAAEYQPAILFIDEVDSLLTARKDNEDAASGKIKTQASARRGCSSARAAAVCTHPPLSGSFAA
jgi:hypothetical protein